MMDGTKIEKNFDKFSTDVDENSIPDDIKIKPDYYIHYALIKAQNCFLRDNAEMGFSQYLIFIDHIEQICKASKTIGDEYDKKVSEYMDSKEYKEDQSKGIIKSVKLANRKLKFMLTDLFGQRAYYGSLEDKK